MARLPFRLPRVPLPSSIRGIPAPAVRLISLLVAVNIVVWAAAGVVLRFFPKLIGPAVLSYTLGLRHALDADHITAIDLMTRRLIAAGRRPVAVGTFFSLGHSTIVVITCIVVAATSGALRDRFEGFQRVGGIIGTSVSAAFLLILCAANGWVLWRLVRRLKAVLAEQRAQRDAASDDDEDDVARNADDNAAVADHLGLETGGCMSTVFRKMFKLVDRPWKMFPLGVLFGLGFDTSSEIAILGIASIQGAQGTSLWVILIFPVLFTGKFPRRSRSHVRSNRINSRNVFAGHHRRSADDGPLHLQGICSGHHRSAILLHRLNGHNSICIRIHRYYPGSVSRRERCRA